MSVAILDEADVRRIVREEQTRPEYVTQRSVEAVVGLARREFTRLARAGEIPTHKERRLIIARTADVIAWIEMRLRVASAPAANLNADPETIALARVGARRVSQ